MDDRVGKAFDFAQEVTKQLITLATAVIALTITFAKDFIGTVPEGTRSTALWAWGCFLGSVFFGVWTLMAMTGTLDASDKTKPPSIFGINIWVPSVLQIVLFLIGLGLTITFGWRSVR